MVAIPCLLATVVRMMASFNSIADSGGTPRPSELAEGITLAVIPTYAAFPFGILGIVLLVVGLIVRRRTAN